MTIKYYPTFLYKEYDEKMLEFLNKMNNKGYSLTDIHFFMKFEKTDEPLKYQIDYTKRTEELDCVYKQLGYYLIGSYAGRQIYGSKNIDVADLISDYESYKTSKLKYYSLGPLVFCIFILLLSFLLLKPLLSVALSSLGCIYANLENVLSLLYVISLVVLLFFVVILTYIKRLAIQKDTFSYQKFKKYDAIYYYSYIALTFIYLTACIYCQVYPLAFFILVIMLVPLTFLQYTAEYKLPKTASIKKRIIYSIICFIIYCTLYTGARLFADSFSSSDKNYSSNRFVEITTYNHGRFYDCKNEKVAKEIYDYLIPNNSNVTQMDSSFEKCTLSPVWFEYNGEELFVTDFKRFIIKEETLVIESEIIENLEEELSFFEKLIEK